MIVSRPSARRWATLSKSSETAQLPGTGDMGRLTPGKQARS